MNPARLSRGGLIDRTRRWRFTFDGRTLDGHPGDTLASALLANGVRLVGRSFKYHRPRGIVTAGVEEPNALVELRGGPRREPNTKATTIELYDGLVAASQNRWPSLRLDLMAANGLFAPFLGAGFYYKTFMWPPAWWEKLYEPAIRRAAGLGRAAGAPDPDAYEKAHAFGDVLVIGGGPAGLMAARTAARAGARVILCELDWLLGGRLLAELFHVDGMPGADWARSVEAELAAMPEVRLLRRTAVLGAYDGGTFAALERVADHLPEPPPGTPRQRYWKIVAPRVVLATGAVERPLVLGGNDRPGVMLASAVRTYLNRFAVSPGRRAVVFTTGDDGWRTVTDLHAAGVTIAAVVDARAQVAADLVTAARDAGARVHLGAVVEAAHGGAAGLRAVTVADGHGKKRRVDAELLALAGGWNPCLGIATHLGHRPRWSETAAAFVPGDSLPAGMAVAGAAGGAFTLAAALRGGAEAGAAAAGSSELPPMPRAEDEKTGFAPCWRVLGSPGKAFVDFQNDVTARDLPLAERDGFGKVEHLKRYTTLGMATDQGRTASVNGAAILAELTGRSLADVGTTRLRPPDVPVAIGALAGSERGPEFRPTRRTPGHGWTERQGAVFVEAGLWLRAQRFPQAGEADDWLANVSREVSAVRGHVGVCDVSTLGKIDVQGADAGLFLDRIYANAFSTLPVGRCRYGLMLREDGFVFDDGTAARLAPEHFVVTTTTAQAAAVMQHLEFGRQVLWPGLDVQLAPVTEQWAQYAIAGPESREVVSRLVENGFDLSNEAFPHRACAAVTLRDGTPGRLFRLSFSGELAYELAVPARRGEALAEAIMAAGAEHGIVPYGTEALGTLRIEKGHLGGGELNGQTTAHDLGLARMLSTKKDFIGRTSAQRLGLTDPSRPRLVGLKPVDPKDRLRAGAHLLEPGATPSLAADQGHLTSAAYSPTLRHWIALGLLRHGPERHGERLRAFDPVRGGDVVVEVRSPVFVDPEGSRLHG